jgi:LDH2 family malate/lactate/ureidoglycolate dehydrogenase
MAEVETRTYPAQYLSEFCAKVFATFVIPEGDARLAADVLAVSDLRGIDSHGVARMYHYVEQLASGRINPRPNIHIIRETPSTATVDGDMGLGLVVGPKANAIAMDRADKVGTGWVAVCNTNHYGIAGYYVLEALKRDQIGWSMTNTSSVVAPLWGAQRRLGTNPLAIAFPGLEEPPVVIDMATTSAAYGRIEMALRRGMPIPQGWIIDVDGNPSTDPSQILAGGAMLPLGSDRDRGGHKGYCLAAMIDILCGPLSGASWGAFAPAFTVKQPGPERTVGRGIGHFFGAMRIDAFIDVNEFKRQIDDWIRTMRSTKAAPGTSGPLIPGDPEREAERVRRVQGIPLVMPVVEELRAVSRQTGVAFD